MSVPAAGEEVAEAAYELVGRLENQLSSYIPSSDISHINCTAAERPARVEPKLFDLLKTCKRLSDRTEGAFDITVGPLVRAWGFHQRQGQMPSEDEIEEARSRVGMDLVRLDEENLTVGFERPGVEINLGAIGKGYVVQRVIDALREWGVTGALVHSGASSIAAIGRPEDEEGWLVGVADPRDDSRALKLLTLTDSSVSISGNSEQFFKLNGRTFSHIIDPRTGWPAETRMLRTAVVGPSAAETDALATAFFVMGVDKALQYCEGNSDFAAILVSGDSADSMHTHIVGVPS